MSPHIVKKFVGLLGGQIAVQSEPEEGSIFIVTLPLSGARPALRSPAAEQN